MDAAELRHSAVTTFRFTSMTPPAGSSKSTMSESNRLCWVGSYHFLPMTALVLAPVWGGGVLPVKTSPEPRVKAFLHGRVQSR